MQFPLIKRYKNVNGIHMNTYGLECPDKVTLLFSKIECWSHY